MSVQEIESAIAQLPPPDVAEIARWIAGFQSASESQTERDLADIQSRLRNLVKEVEVQRWLAAPNALLGDLSPREAIICGQTDRVSELLAAVEEGIHV